MSPPDPHNEVVGFRHGAVNGFSLPTNVEFGFAAVAVIGAQWLFQKMRLIKGANTQLPGFRMGYLTHGEINPTFTGVVIND